MASSSSNETLDILNQLIAKATLLQAIVPEFIHSDSRSFLTYQTIESTLDEIDMLCEDISVITQEKAETLAEFQKDGVEFIEIDNDNDQPQLEDIEDLAPTHNDKKKHATDIVKRVKQQEREAKMKEKAAIKERKRAEKLMLKAKKSMEKIEKKKPKDNGKKRKVKFNGDHENESVA